MAHEPKHADELVKAPPTSYRRRDVIARAQMILPVVAVLAVAAFWLSQWLWHAEARYSPGALANVHSQWDNQCAACHESTAPLAAQNWYARLTDQTHVADAKCQSCHRGPAHHAVENRSEVAGCTSCHREHRGSPGQLLAIADTHCTNCHADLKATEHPLTKFQTTFQNVTGFSKDQHPEFALLREKAKDPGTIAFNHARHMSPGMGADANSPGPFTLAQLPENQRERYRAPGQTGADAPVTLNCRSCHNADARDVTLQKGELDGLPVAPLRPARTAGNQMAPIVYEVHCQACHPLTIDRKIPGDRSTDWLTVRHRVQPKEALETLRGHYANLLLKGLWTPPEKTTPLLPGKLPENKAAAKSLDAQAEGDLLSVLVERNQKSVEQKVLGQTTCQKCHPSIDPAKGIDQSIPPANIPSVWFQHARFDHTSHRAVECRECHAVATTSKVSADVMLPSIESCVKCHAPSRGLGTTATGGARFDCIACHTYHHADSPLSGRGSRARQPVESKSIDEFLRGN